MRLLDIKKTRTAPYRPQSDGTVERVNRTIKGMLSAYVDRDYESWDEYLPFVLLSYRSTVHESTGCTPNLLFLNRECNLPIDFFFDPPPETNSDPCPIEYVEWMKQAGRRTHKFVREKLKGALIRQKRNYDKTACLKSFQVGNLVYREYLPQAREHKFAHPWKGPYKILEKIGDVNYKIEPVAGGASVVVHVDHLKLCLTRSVEPVPEFDPESESESESESSDSESNSELHANQNDSAADSVDVSTDAVPQPDSPPAVRTRVGRLVKPPDRLDL